MRKHNKNHNRPSHSQPEAVRMRIDKWLWAARFYRTRTLAKEAIESGRVHYAGSRVDIAKSHIRHLIGGHAHVENEQLLKVVFPERPGALLTFLEKLGDDFNITLFHYRNHGAAEGRVLVGLQASMSNSRQLQDALLDIGYDCTMLNDNVAYQLFLK